MTVTISARKLTAGAGVVCRPILTRAAIDKAVKELQRRYGRDLAGINPDAMSQCEREVVAREIIRIAEARISFGMEPCCPLHPAEADSLMQFPYLSDRRYGIASRVDAVELPFI